MSLLSQIEEELERFCDQYCKYPQVYEELYGDDDATDMLLSEKCRDCPIGRII